MDQENTERDPWTIRVRLDCGDAQNPPDVNLYAWYRGESLTVETNIIASPTTLDPDRTCSLLTILAEAIRATERTVGRLNSTAFRGPDRDVPF